MNKLLLITYSYPPSNTPGVFRIISFVNYLCEFGFEPIVLTVSNPIDHMIDEDLHEFVRKPVAVHRVPGVDPKAPVRFLRKAIAYLARTGRKKAKKTPFRDHHVEAGKKGLKWTVTSMFEFPDSRVGWAPSAIVKALRLIHKHNISYVLTSSPPHSIHLVGLALKLLHPRCVWVSDYRDPWTIDHSNVFLLPPALERVRKRLEVVCHKHADMVVANTTTNREALLHTNSFLAASKVIVIPNGVDPADFSGLAPIRGRDGRGHIECVFVGSLYQGMIDGLLQALVMLKKTKATILENLRFSFVGYADESDRAKVESLGLAGTIRFRGMVSYRESLQYMLDADLLLYLLPAGADRGHWIPSKLYNYLPAERPILAIIPEGDAARIIRQLHVGQVIEPSQTAEIAAYLENFVSRPEGCYGRLDFEEEPARRFTRRYLTQELAESIGLLGQSSFRDGDFKE